MDLKYTASSIYKLEKKKGKSLNEFISVPSTDVLISLIQAGTNNEDVDTALQKIDDYLHQEGDNNGNPKDVYNLYCDICEVLFHDGFLLGGADIATMRKTFNTKATSPLSL